MGHLAQRMHLGRKLVSKCHNLPKPLEKGFVHEKGITKSLWTHMPELSLSRRQMEINEMR